MIPRFRYALHWTAFAASLVLIAPGSPAAGWEGSWVLVEQTYGRGSANMVAGGPPLMLELRRARGQITGKVWEGKNRENARPWPSAPGPDRDLPVQVVEKREEVPGKQVVVHYEVDMMNPDGLMLDITESYGLDDDGKSLVGTVRVLLRVGEKPQGSYVLHRRFERVP